MKLKFSDIHVGQRYLYGDNDEVVEVLHMNSDTGLATVEFYDTMRVKSVIAESLRPLKVSVAPAFKNRRVFKPVDTIEVNELSAAKEIKDALSGLVNDIGEEGSDEDSEDYEQDFQDESDEGSHSWGTVDPFKGMSPSSLVEFNELLHDHGFDMSLIEMDSKSIRFKGTAMGFLWGLLAMAEEPEFDEEE